MRTTIDIDPKLLSEAMRLCKAKTKKELIHTSLSEFVRRRHIEELKNMAGTVDLDLDAEKLHSIG